MRPTVDVFGRSIATYGLLFVAGLYLALALFVFLAPRRSINRSRAFLVAVCGIIGGLVGARLLFVITHISLLWQAIKLADWSLVFRLFFEGGLVFFGGLIGGILVALVVAMKMTLPVIQLADLAAPAVALGQAIGRLGCHFAGCCYGLPHEACGVIFPEGSLAPHGVALFPTQLIESSFMLLLSVVLVILMLNARVGLAASFYFVLYGVFRFIIEFFRGDQVRGFLGPHSTSQWIALASFAFGVWLFCRQVKRPADVSIKK